MADLLAQLTEVDDASIEIFELFSEAVSGQDLGIVSSKEQSLDVSIGRYDLTIAQSPALLHSDRSEGTTGAVLWRSSLHLANWLINPANAIFQYELLRPGNTAIELGAGSAGLISAILATRLGPSGHVIASDMKHVTKLLQQNMAAHFAVLQGARSTAKKASTKLGLSQTSIVDLDWEHDDVVSLLASHGRPNGVDAIFACDCVYNYALIKPFLDTCRDICRMRSNPDIAGTATTYCIVAQQLRQPEVLEEWLTYALLHFDVWRLPSLIVDNDLSVEHGYVVHILRIKHGHV